MERSPITPCQGPWTSVSSPVYGAAGYVSVKLHAVRRRRLALLLPPGSLFLAAPQGIPCNKRAVFGQEVAAACSSFRKRALDLLIIDVKADDACLRKAPRHLACPSSCAAGHI